jgi:hypothetical protein
MIHFFHEKPNPHLNPLRGDSRASIIICSPDPGRPCRDKDRCSLLTLEGQRLGWICEILGMSRQTLNVLMHRVNKHKLTALEPPKRPGRPAQLTPKIRQELQEHLEKSPSGFGLNRV